MPEKTRPDRDQASAEATTKPAAVPAAAPAAVPAAAPLPRRAAVGGGVRLSRAQLEALRQRLRQKFH